MSIEEVWKSADKYDLSSGKENISQLIDNI